MPSGALVPAEAGATAVLVDTKEDAVKGAANLGRIFNLTLLLDQDL
jgi:hypothetical protein